MMMPDAGALIDGAGRRRLAGWAGWGACVAALQRAGPALSAALPRRLPTWCPLATPRRYVEGKEHRIRQAFASIDADGDGALDAGEVQRAARGEPRAGGEARRATLCVSLCLAVVAAEGNGTEGAGLSAAALSLHPLLGVQAWASAWLPRRRRAW